MACVIRNDHGGSCLVKDIREAYAALELWDYHTEDGSEFWRVSYPTGEVTRAWIEAA